MVWYSRAVSRASRSVLIVLTGCFLAYTPQVHADDAPLRRIAFGSCNAQQYPQPIWQAVVDSDPDLWIWTGDIVYADADSIEPIRAAYAMQKKRPEYAKLRERCRIIGVWDDHDYGLDNGGSEYPIKRESQAALLDFLDEPADSPRRSQAGVYTKYSFGPPGQRVQIILLDTRYHRDPPGPHGDVLGAEQWEWLEKALGNDAQITVIVSSVQVIPEEHRFEKWANFPESRAQLLRLIKESGRACVLISGDRHIAEISMWETSGLPHPLYEVTSSGLTHSWKDFPGEPNQYRIGPVFSELHFGVLEIDWDSKPGAISMEIRDVNGVERIRHRVLLSDLAPWGERTHPR